VWSLSFENKLPTLHLKQEIQAHARTINDILILSDKNFVCVIMIVVTYCIWRWKYQDLRFEDHECFEKPYLQRKREGKKPFDAFVMVSIT
jgi:hypothetical protein